MMKSFNSVVRLTFYNLGGTVAHYPIVFVILPVIITGVLSLGFLNLEVQNDIEYLYTPSTGHSAIEREQIAKYFPTNDSGQFTISRKSVLGHFIR